MPLLAGRLGGSRLLLADLGPAIGAPAPGSGEAEDAPPRRAAASSPTRSSTCRRCARWTPTSSINIGIFDPGTDIIEPLQPARAHLLLADGVLTIADFEGVTAQGKLAGYLQLDGRGKEALWTADMRLLGVDLAQWLRIKRKGDAPPYLTGKLDALVKVKGSGRSTAEILGSLDGDLRMHMREAAISHLAVEAAGIDVAQALGMLVKGDEALPIQCNVADLDIVKGVARPKVFVVNTRDSTIWVDGTVSLRDESLDLRVRRLAEGLQPADAAHAGARRRHARRSRGLARARQAGRQGRRGGAAGAAQSARGDHPVHRPGLEEGRRPDRQRMRRAGAQRAASIPAAVRNPKSTHVPPAAPPRSAASGAAVAKR